MHGVNMVPFSIVEVQFPRPDTEKPGTEHPVIFRQPGCLLETLEAFRPILANGLVVSTIIN